MDKLLAGGFKILMTSGNQEDPCYLRSHTFITRTNLGSSNKIHLLIQDDQLTSQIIMILYKMEYLSGETIFRIAEASSHSFSNHHQILLSCSMIW